MTEGNMSFRGIHEIEMNERESEYRTGVPGLGARQALLAAPVRKTSRIKLTNTGVRAVDARVAHGGSEKTATAENVVALNAGTAAVGKLQFRDLTPGTVVLSEAGALPNIVDSLGDGVLHDVGDPSAVRGTIDYQRGIINADFGAAVTLPLLIDYDHGDFTEFESAEQTDPDAVVGGAYPETIALAFGRIVPGTVSYEDSSGGPLTFEDDGKGNIVETTAGSEANVGTIDYATGVITQTAGSAALTSPVTALKYKYNPFGRRLVAGAGRADFSLLSGEIPELTDEVFADGSKGESEVAIIAECDVPDDQSSLVCQFVHFGEEQYRVRQLFSGFPPGGESNDSRINLISN